PWPSPPACPSTSPRTCSRKSAATDRPCPHTPSALTGPSPGPPPCPAFRGAPAETGLAWGPAKPLGSAPTEYRPAARRARTHADPPPARAPGGPRGRLRGTRMPIAPSARVHPSAVVDPRADLGPDVEVGPHVVIEGEVRVGAGTVLRPGVHLVGPLTLG